MPSRDENDDMLTRSVSPNPGGPPAAHGAGPDAETVRLGEQRSSSGLSRSSFASDPSESLPPGTMLASRYRVVAKLGAGGMGAVYRADDLTLNQAVALKFLPPSVANDPVRIDRLRQEVRIGRDVSHPAVCRIYDIGEHQTPEGALPFITMEYIDGEDLASLLRRIGALPKEKALQIVRQVCAGLGAAHERGVLHRDLKPANVMLDARGNARISDFGLAALGTRVSGHEAAAGTPLYMAPEQLRGEEASVRSDIYALGLLMYELMTGARPHEGETFEEIRLARTNVATSTERVLDDQTLDPLVSRVIARCLDPDPARRPQTALAVAAALPGGDPLAAALAAGETPSPDMVAESGGVGRLHPAIAFLLLAISLVIPVGGSMWASQYAVSRYQPLQTPPVVMEYKATEILRELGLNRSWAQTAHGYGRMDGYMKWALAQPDPEIAERALRETTPPYVFFWYRATPFPWAEPADAGFYRGLVTASSPARGIEGEVYVSLDLEGRVRRLFVEPPDVTGAAEPESRADGDAILRMCGLEPAAMTPVEPRIRFATRAEQRLAWEGVWPERPEVAVRVEAGIADGRVSYIASLSPWEVESFTSRVTAPLDTSAEPMTLQKRAFQIFGAILGRALFVAVLALIFAGAWISRRNILNGRGDTRAATRFAWCMGGTMLIARWFIAEDLAPRTRFDVLDILAWAMLVALGSWSAYLAIEPIVRRRWPTTLVAWTRLMGGRPMDPLVGRSVLLGVFLGVVAWAGYRVAHLLPLGDDVAARSTLSFGVNPPWVEIGMIATAISVQSMMGLLFILILVAIRRATRRTWAAVALMTIVFFLFDESRAVGLGSSSGWGNAARIGLPIAWSLLVSMTLTLLYIRVGVLAAIAFIVTENIARQIPALSDWTAWQAWPAIAPTLAIGLMAIWGASASAFGRSARDVSLIDSGLTHRSRTA